MNDQLLYAPAQAAKLLGISRTTFYVLLDTGQIASVKIGAARRVHRSEIERVAAEGATARVPAGAA